MGVASWHIYNPIPPKSIYMWERLSLFPLESSGQEACMETCPSKLKAYNKKSHHRMCPTPRSLRGLTLSCSHVHSKNSELSYHLWCRRQFNPLSLTYFTINHLYMEKKKLKRCKDYSCWGKPYDSFEGSRDILLGFLNANMPHRKTWWVCCFVITMFPCTKHGLVPLLK